MPGESKRGTSPRGRASESTGRRPRTRSMTHQQPEEEPHHSAGIPDGGATGSEINNDGGGSPDSHDSPPATSTRKKARRSKCEITEEPTTDAAQTTEAAQTTRNDVVPNDAPREQRVYWFSQYVTLKLWRAVENFEVWDHRLVKAFREGPRSFATRVNGAARQLTRRLTGSGSGSAQTELQPEAVAQTYLDRFRPRGLYDVCARIFQTQRKSIQNARPLKRKKPESDTEEGFWSFPEDGQKFKHRFLMQPPRLIILSGPDKGVDEDVEMTD